MKLSNPVLQCGGLKGCGMIFEFPEGATTEEAGKKLREHRERPNHMEEVLAEQNRNRLVAGLAPLTMEELFGEPAPKVNSEFNRFALMIEEGNRASLAKFRAQMDQMREEAERRKVNPEVTE
mgnify:CR=1 FL=1